MDMISRGTGKLARKLAVFGMTVVMALALQAQNTLYWGGGTSDIGDGTPLPSNWDNLAGNWTNSTKNWSNAVSPTVYQAWTDGAVANLGMVGGTANNLDIVPNFNPTISGLFFDSTGCTPNARYYTLAPSSTQTLTLSGARVPFLVQANAEGAYRGIKIGTNLNLAGTGTLVKDGLGSLLILGSKSYSGPIEVRSSILNVQNTGYITGVDTINVFGYFGTPNSTDIGQNVWSTPKFEVNSPNSSGTINQLSNNLVITLRRGLFGWQSNASSVENISQILLNNHGEYGRIDGTAGGYVNLTHATQGIDRGTTGTLMMHVDNTGTQGVLRSGLAVENGIATDTLLPWLTTNRGGFIYLDSADNNKAKLVAQTERTYDPTTWGSGENVLVTSAGTGTLSSDLNINSLGVTAGATTINIGSGNTLTIDAGAINTAQQLTFSGGNIATSASQFYFANNNNLTINSVLSGTYDIIKSGTGTLSIGGVNTFEGNLIVNSGLATLSNNSAVPNGSITVHSGGGLNISTATSANQITIAKDALLVCGTTSTFNGIVIVNGGVVNTNSHSATFSGSGYGLVFNGGIIGNNTTATRNLNILTNVKYESTAASQAVIQRNLGTNSLSMYLNSGSSATRTFDIANSSTLPSDIPEMLIDLPIVNGSGGTGGLIKSGSGVLKLTGANTYTGGTTVNGGTLQLGVISAVSQSGLTASATSSTSIASRMVTFNQPITNTMAVGQTITGTNIPSGRVITGILDDYRVFVDGASGASANVRTTDVAVGSVSRTGSLAGNVTVNDGGTLQLDNGTSVAGTVTVNDGGTLHNSGTIGGAVTVAAGGTATGSGTFNNTVTVNGTFSPGGNSTAFTVNINSTLTFGPGSTLYFNLGAVSDKISFPTPPGDYLAGSGNATLSLILGAGFSYGATYTIFENVTTEGFTFANIVGYDTVGYTANFAKVGDNYVLSFTANPTLKVPWDFNGDGKSDVSAFALAGDNWGWIYLMNGSMPSEFGKVYRSTNLDWQMAGIADFNGDGKADIIWQNNTTRQVIIYLMNGLSITSKTSVYDGSTGWVIDKIADFNGDGKADILWRDPGTGAGAMWLMNGTVVLESGSITRALNWVALDTGDYNNDGKADILWEIDSATGKLYLMNGITVSSQGDIYTRTPPWVTTGFADFNGDGCQDILWNNPTTNSGFMMLMDGLTVEETGIPYADQNLAWSIVALGDFNGDGKADFLWQNSSTGNGVVWLMNGYTKTAHGTVYKLQMPTTWSIKKVLDFNGDGKSDLLWQNTTYEGVTYIMDGTSTPTAAKFMSSKYSRKISEPFATNP